MEVPDSDVSTLQNMLNQTDEQIDQVKPNELSEQLRDLEQAIKSQDQPVPKEVERKRAKNKSKIEIMADEHDEVSS